MKHCYKCGTDKPTSDFYKAGRRPDGLQTQCKRCQGSAKTAWLSANQERAKRAGREWNAKNADRVKVYQRGRYEANREAVIARTAAHQKANPERYARYTRDSHLRRTYGITLEEYDAMLASQGGACAICGTTEFKYPSADVDHCHKTGAVRGLLCRKCNAGIGYLREDVSVLRRAVEYLGG